MSESITTDIERELRESLSELCVEVSNLDGPDNPVVRRARDLLTPPKDDGLPIPEAWYEAAHYMTCAHLPRFITRMIAQYQSRVDGVNVSHAIAAAAIAAAVATEKATGGHILEAQADEVVRSLTAWRYR